MDCTYSIIVPVYNRPDEVRELLESLTAQTRKDFEVVIVEDGSTTDCRAVAESFAGRLDLKYFAKKNSGPGLSRNYGAEWDKPYSFCAVAADANGTYGPVFRKTVTFTRSGASPVSELQLTGATTAKAAPMIRLSSVGRFGVKTR